MPPPPVPKPPTSIWPIILAGVLAVMVLVVLSFLTLGWIIPVIVIGGGIFGIGAFHYFVWGWWLSGLIRDHEAADQSQREADQSADAAAFDDEDR